MNSHFLLALTPSIKERNTIVMLPVPNARGGSRSMIAEIIKTANHQIKEPNIIVMLPVPTSREASLEA
jgi:hypothetical protein